MVDFRLTLCLVCVLRPPLSIASPMSASSPAPCGASAGGALPASTAAPPSVASAVKPPSAPPSSSGGASAGAGGGRKKAGGRKGKGKKGKSSSAPVLPPSQSGGRAPAAAARPSTLLTAKQKQALDNIINGSGSPDSKVVKLRDLYIQQVLGYGGVGVLRCAGWWCCCVAVQWWCWCWCCCVGDSLRALSHPHSSLSVRVALGAGEENQESGCGIQRCECPHEAAHVRA